MIPSLDIIIVNWNTANQLRDCLGSISLANKESVQLNNVVIIDNASTDNSATGLEVFGLPIVVQRNKENCGFGAACNQGARLGQSKYLLFLNPDTWLFADSISPPAIFMEQAECEDVGILGIQLLNDRETIERTCSRFPTVERFLTTMIGLDRLFPSLFDGHFMLEWDHKQTRDVDQVMGSFFLVRRSMFEQLGGFDRRFFVYFEEVDFSLRAKKLGFRTLFFSECSAYHKGGGSSEKVKAVRLFYFLRSRIQYAYKHFPWLGATLVCAGTLVVEPFARLVAAMLTFSFERASEIMTGYVLLWRVAPRLIAKRGMDRE